MERFLPGEMVLVFWGRLGGSRLLVISETQITALDEAATRAFLKRTDAHLRQWFPQQCKSISKEQMQMAIRTGWNNAKSYGFNSESCIRCYLELMCLTGSHFHADPLLPWAAEILGSQAETPEKVRGDLLHKQAWDYAKNTAKDYPSIAQAALTKRGDKKLEPRIMPALLQEVRQQLVQLFPAKCAYVGNEKLVTTISKSLGSAAAYGCTTERSGVLYAATRFILGEAFDRDPFLPWASQTLHHSAIGDKDARVESVFATALLFLQRRFNWSETSEGTL